MVAARMAAGGRRRGHVLESANLEEQFVTEEPKSLITDEHRALIGKRSGRDTMTVSEVDARRMRDVLGDGDSRWADGTGVAPPYILAMISGPRRVGSMPRILPGGLLTQQEWKFYRPFRLGEELVGHTQVVDIRERLGGRYGHSVLVTMSTDWFDAEENHVASTLNTLTQFDPRAGRKGDDE